MRLEHLTTAETEQALARTQTVIVPFGVLEAHGTHMPLATDTIQAYDGAIRTAEMVPVFVAAPVHYGICRSASGHPGTIGITGDTFRSLVYDIVCSLHRSGMKNIILYSGHASGKQLAAMAEAGEKAIDEIPHLNVAVVSDYDILKNAECIETPGDIHAGELETSRMMHVQPQLVRTDKIPPAEKRQFPAPILVRDCRRYWPGTVEGKSLLGFGGKGQNSVRNGSQLPGRSGPED